MTSFSIEDVGLLDEVAECVMAELLDLITMQDIHPDDGLNEIEFSHFDLVGDLDEGVLDQLIPLSKKLTKLTLSLMDETSEANRSALIHMSQKIFNQRPPLAHLNFYDFFASEETAQQGEPLLHALATIMQPTLLSLDLGLNSKLWEDETRFNLLLDVLQHQYNIEDLNLAYSDFSSVQTEQLLR